MEREKENLEYLNSNNDIRESKGKMRKGGGGKKPSIEDRIRAVSEHMYIFKRFWFLRGFVTMRARNNDSAITRYTPARSRHYFTCKDYKSYYYECQK